MTANSILTVSLIINVLVSLRSLCCCSKRRKNTEEKKHRFVFEQMEWMLATVLPGMEPGLQPTQVLVYLGALLDVDVGHAK